MATNKHFNATMNQEQKAENVAMTGGVRRRASEAKTFLADLSKTMTRNLDTSPQSGTADQQRYGKTSRRDFARKTNSFAPVLINDSYSNFRFAKRAGEVFSPLSTKQFGVSYRSKLRKASQFMNSQMLGARSSTNSREGLPRLPIGGGERHARHNSVAPAAT